MKNTSSNNTTKKSSESGTNLSKFISDISTNIGFSISGQGKKEKYNPFATENTTEITKLHKVVKEYSKKTSSSNLITPISVSKTKKKVSFEFGKEIKEKVFDSVIESKGINDVSLDESNKKIEISL